MTLHHRLSTATPDQQWELIEELWLTGMGSTYVSDSPERHERLRRFSTMLDYGAYLDAVMLMADITDDHWLELYGPRKYLSIPTPAPGKWSARLSRFNHEGEKVGWGATPALALASAIAAAKGV